MPQFIQGVDVLPKSWPRTPHDDVQISGGRKVGDVPTVELFRIFTGLKVPGISSELGRGALVDLFAKHLERIGNEGRVAAVNSWLEAGR